MSLATRIVLIALALPTYIAVYTFRAGRVLWRARYALSTSVTCLECRQPIALVGAWKCKCGYTWVGSTLRTCPSCYTRATFVRCTRCHVTRRIGVIAVSLLP